MDICQQEICRHSTLICTLGHDLLKQKLSQKQFVAVQTLFDCHNWEVSSLEADTEG